MNIDSIPQKTHQNRGWLVAGGVGVIALIQALAIVSMLPLKEKVPYLVEANKTTGEVVAKDNMITRFAPTELNKAFFIRNWVENAFTMDASRTKAYLLPAATEPLRGPAVGQFNRFIEADKPIERLVDNPLLARHVKNININFVPGADVAIVRFALETTGNGISTESVNKSASIKFILIEKEMTETNPLGFFITDVNLKDDI